MWDNAAWDRVNVVRVPPKFYACVVTSVARGQCQTAVNIWPDYIRLWNGTPMSQLAMFHAQTKRVSISTKGDFRWYTENSRHTTRHERQEFFFLQ